ncbi:hypothetical protein DPMN_155310 [Dreissena polymorpha]|uniref:Uncharacterized protein n=1 Tax=Dreissena polymorpha TaxID=45954 RepID=A0A9D4JB88_DREPO|nr:hypothetical protein DPMN_155310 [Dreissena polymorpha]
MWTGIGRANPTTISPAELEKERKYKELEDRIDQFPNQIDRFLASISNMYMGDGKLDNMLHKGMAHKMAQKAELQQDHPMPRPMQSGVRLSPGAKG